LSAEPSEQANAWGVADGFRETLLAYYPPADAQALRRIAEILMLHAMESRPNRDDELPDPLLSFQAVGRELRFLERYLDELAVTLESQEIPNLAPSAAAAFAVRTRRRALRLGRMAGKFEHEVTLGI
jgi:hypothetical protein